MTRIYNRTTQKKVRRRFRKDAPKAERLLWSGLRNGQADGLKIRRQYGVRNYVVDFYCPRAKRAIEVDGESHFDDQARRNDAERRAFIESFGIRSLRFTNRDVYHRLDDVVEEIWRTARDRIGKIRCSDAEPDPPNPPLARGGG